MKKNYMRLLTMILTLALVFTMTCGTCFAADTPLLISSNPASGTTETDSEQNTQTPALTVNLSEATVTLSRELTTADMTNDRKSIEPSVLASVVKVTQSGTDVTSYCTLTASVSGLKAVITASITDGDGITAVNSSKSLEVTMKTNMSDCVIEILDYKQVYTGEALKPAVRVYNLLTNGILTENLEYQVEYKDNVNAGFATVTAKGLGNYTGTTLMYFIIEAKDLYDHNCTAFFTNGRNSSAFTGKEIQPLVTVRDGARKKVLTQGTDYTVVYKDAAGKVVTGLKEAGEYTVTVEGLSNYTGKMELPYEIIGTEVDGYEITLRYDKVKADGTAKVPEILSVKLGEKSALTTSEYDVSYLDPAGNPVTADAMIKPGVYTVVVTAKSGFSGTITTKFEIVGAEQEIIEVKDTYKAYKKTANFKLEPVASGDATGFTFESSNPEVASVTADGVVDVKKLGRAVITIKTTGETICKQAEKKVIVMVYPYKAVMTKKPWTDGGKKSFKVRWETQDDVTYYQVRYSRNKNFKSGTYNTKKITAKDYKTQSTTIKNLKSGKRYYVKVRAVKVVENDYGEKLYYYGAWSSWKSVVTK